MLGGIESLGVVGTRFRSTSNEACEAGARQGFATRCGVVNNGWVAVDAVQDSA